MRGRQKVVIYLLLIMIVSSFVGVFAKVSADRAASTNYILDTSTYGTFGGDNSSTNYKLTDTGGESIVGDGASGSYILKQGYQASLEKSISLAVQPAGLLAYFPLDEGSGTVAWDVSSTNAPAFFAGTPTWSGSGQVGGAITTSSGNYLATTATSVYNTSTLTACAWANMTSSIGSNPVFLSRSAATQTDNNWALGFNLAVTKSKAQIVLGGTLYSVVSSLAAPTMGTWIHSCLTYDGTTLKLYVNGQPAGSTAPAAALGTCAQPISIGAKSTGTQPLNGLVDEAKVYNRALSADEISTMYTGEAAGLQSGIGLGTITSGVSNTANFDTIVNTDANTYDLSISSNHDLQNGASTIPGVSGSIATPATWSEGTTKGLGFTISAATGLDVKWGTGTKYAAFPTSDTTFFSRSGFTGGGLGGLKDVLNMQARVDVSVTQSTGLYSAQLTVTGTTKP